MTMVECYTDLNTHQFEYKWTIKKFRVYFDLARDEEFVLGSSIFSTKIGNDKLHWHLKLYINDIDSENEGSISLYSYLRSKSELKINVLQRYFIWNGEEKKVKPIPTTPMPFLTTFSRTQGDGRVLFSKEFLLKNAKTHLANDELTLICRITIVGIPVTKSGHSPMEAVSNDSQLLMDIEKLFENEKWSDVTLTVGDTEFKAHKAILMAHSPVFRAMFKHEMVEHKENHVDIADMTPVVLQEMLRFIYTNKAQHVDEIADELLAAADKYGLDKLKGLCEETLSNMVDVKNATQILILADRHNCKRLMVHVIMFIHAYAAEVVNTLGFKMLETSYPHLITKLYRTKLTKTMQL